eukprot:c9271_g2_i2.p1 GENE.c9271_g2_i2~~c9271_g2_i2.p1  ORF type:complete len:325 (+),score=62.73 c9271_g2_i2:168-1142(+)
MTEENWISYPLHDVWINTIGPDLQAKDIIALSFVNKWGNDIAHNIQKHRGMVELNTVQHFASASLHWPNLQLGLALRRWTQKNAREDDISMHVCLRSLSLHNCQIHNFQCFATTKLQVLAIQDETTNLQPAIRNSLERLLVSCTVLESLSVTLADLYADSGRDVVWFARGLKGMKYLSHLRLWNCRLGCQGVQKICQALGHLETSFALELGHNIPVNNLPADVAEMCNCLRLVKHLTRLDLTGNYLGNEGAKSLSHVLSTFKDLTDLNLRENKIGDEAVNEHVIPELMSRPNLICLDLQLNDLKSETKDKIRRELLSELKLVFV